MTSNHYLWYLIFCTVSFIFGGCINIWGGVINKAGPKSHLVFYNQYKNCPPAQTKYWKHFDVQVQLTDRPRLPYIQAVFDLMISYQPSVKTHPVPQRFFWRQLAWRQFFRSHLRARQLDRSRLKIVSSSRYPIFSLAFTSSLSQVGKHVLPTGSLVQVIGW